MYYLPCFVLLVLLAAAAKIHFKQQAPVTCTKQGRQADKAAEPASFVLCLLLARALQCGFLIN
jgi:hypothetical protein